MSNKYYKNVKNFISIPNYLKNIQTAKTGAEKIGGILSLGNLLKK